MDYFVNSALLSSAFTIPSVVVDNYLKFAKAEHIKVLLYILRNMWTELRTEDISEQTDLSEYEVKEALLYRADTGILLPKEQPKQEVKKPEATKAVTRSEKPSRTDIAKRGNEDAKIRYLLQETQLKLGRNLKSNEASTLVWLYDDQGLDVSLILLIVEFAVKHNKANIRFIEATAVDWINNGIDNIIDADKALNKLAVSEQAWSIVCSAFGIQRRKPSKKEAELSYLWINEWKLTKETLISAYDECVNAKSKFSFSYTAKILENWHNTGISSAEESKKAQKDKTNEVSYDLDLYEKMLNSKD